MSVSNQKCPRGHGQLHIEEDDLVCLTCGYRIVDGAKALPSAVRNGHATSEDYIDPFAYLVQVMREALTECRRDLEAAESRIGDRRQQVKRIEKAMAVLTELPAKAQRAAKPKGRPGGVPNCTECGHHPASRECRAHKAAAKAVAA